MATAWWPGGGGWEGDGVGAGAGASGHASPLRGVSVVERQAWEGWHGLEVGRGRLRVALCPRAGRHAGSIGWVGRSAVATREPSDGLAGVGRGWESGAEWGVGSA